MVDHLFSCRIPGTSRGKKKKRSQLYYCYPSDRAKEESWIIESMLKQKGARRLAGCFGSLHFTWASGGLLSSPCRLWQKAWAQNYPEARQKDFHECQGVPAQPWHCRTRESLMGPQFSKRLSTSSKHLIAESQLEFSHQNTTGDGLGVKFSGSFLLEIKEEQKQKIILI